MEARRIVIPGSLGLSDVESLAQSLGQAIHDPEVSALVLEGTVGTFCRGLDADALLATEDDDGEDLDPHRVAVLDTFFSCQFNIQLHKHLGVHLKLPWKMAYWVKQNLKLKRNW